jgi:cation:H+ antiporter
MTMSTLGFQAILFVLGLVILGIGAEGMLRGAVRLAHSFRISPIVIGLTIVAFGTSAPELVVSLIASLNGNDTLAIANVIGSNIANIALILGVTAALRATPVSFEETWQDFLMMLGATFLLFVLALDGQITRLESLLLLCGLFGFTWMSYRRSQHSAVVASEVEHTEDLLESLPPTPGATHLRASLFVLGGIAGLILGARLMVDSAVMIAQAFGLSEAVIGLTLVAIGTSLPELATSIMASMQGETEIAVGNAVGSNIFNIFAIIGAAGVTAPLRVDPVLIAFDFPFLLALSVALVVLVRMRQGLQRVEGVGLLAIYIGYLAWQV